MLSLKYLLILGVVGTSFLSASLGLAGGSALLFLLNFFYPMQQAIAIHGLLQFIGGMSRVGFSWRALRLRPMVPYFVGLGSGTLLSTVIVFDLPTRTLEIVTGAAIVGFALFPSRDGPNIESEAVRFSFKWIFAGGFLAGAFGPVIGVVGPITMPFFLQSGLIGESLVVTKTFCHSAVHITKMGVFWSFLKEFLQTEGGLAIAMLAANFVGTWFGGRWLRRISNKQFLFYSRLLLGIIGVGFLVKAGFSA